MTLRSPTEDKNRGYRCILLDLLSPLWGKAGIGVLGNRSRPSPYLRLSPSAKDSVISFVASVGPRARTPTNFAAEEGHSHSI
jgi:hypothetical protein